MARLPLVSPLDRILFLKAQPYLVGQTPEVLTALASYSEERFYARGSVVRAGAERVEEVLFLVEGRLQVDEVSALWEPPREVAAPGVVGLPHHFAGIHRPPDVRALDDTLCLVIRVGDLDQIVEDYFTLSLAFARRSGQEALRTLGMLGRDRPDEQGFPSGALRETPAQLDIVQRLAHARRAPFFERTNLTVLGQLVRGEDFELLHPGDVLWSKGDPIDRMVLVLDGTLRLDGENGGARAPSGAVVGAFEIAHEGRRGEGWVADSDCRLLPIRRDLFIDLLEDHFDFALDYLHATAEQTIKGWRLLAALAAVEASKEASREAS